jgi:hypothetical protein
MEAPMVPQRDLMISAVFFAAFWTLAMILINTPGAAGAVIFTVAGVIAYSGTSACVGGRTRGHSLGVFGCPPGPLDTARPLREAWRIIAPREDFT